ncbi:hypothetical protein SAMN05660479_00929 [Microbulbifer thermotolerans]|nr:hypothetical protein [Microbulbifer thermotolerans]SFB94852.1 hypothetical protein SAMN05660479_00929 [Microbulbifer thermotolerans]
MDDKNTQEPQLIFATGSVHTSVGPIFISLPVAEKIENPSKEDAREKN